MISDILKLQTLDLTRKAKPPAERPVEFSSCLTVYHVESSHLAFRLVEQLGLISADIGSEYTTMMDHLSESNLTEALLDLGDGALSGLRNAAARGRGGRR